MHDGCPERQALSLAFLSAVERTFTTEKHLKTVPVPGGVGLEELQRAVEEALEGERRAVRALVEHTRAHGCHDAREEK